jgi:hypothetical protein
MLAGVLNPEIIVITGGVATSLAPLQEDILRRVRRRGLPSTLEATTIRVAPADKRGTVRGGAALVLYEMARRDASGVEPPAALRGAGAMRREA